MTYLRLAHLAVGLRVNFNVIVLKTALRRLTPEHPDSFRSSELPVPINRRSRHLPSTERGLLGSPHDPGYLPPGSRTKSRRRHRPKPRPPRLRGCRSPPPPPRDRSRRRPKGGPPEPSRPQRLGAHAVSQSPAGEGPQKHTKGLASVRRPGYRRGARFHGRMGRGGDERQRARAREQVATGTTPCRDER